MAEIIIQIPDALERQLQPFQERLPEVLERGLRDIMADDSTAFHDENAVLELLASRPSPEQLLTLRPTPEFQARASHLLYRGKHGELTSQEQAELERYLVIEHLVRLAKAHAYRSLRNGA